MAVYRHTNPEEDEEESLEEVVSRIQASGRGRVLPKPSAEAVQRFIQEVQLETPLSQEELDEWDAQWAQVMEEMRQRDLADEIAEGRGFGR